MFQIIGRRAGLVAAKFKVARSREIPVVAGGQFDHERVLKRAAGFKFKLGFREGFTQSFNDADVPDARDLRRHLGIGTGV